MMLLISDFGVDEIVEVNEVFRPDFNLLYFEYYVEKGGSPPKIRQSSPSTVS